MSASEWTSLVDPEGTLSGLFGATNLPLASCELFYLQIDERERSVTIGFETPNLPPHPPASWGERPYNMFEFYLEFTDVSGLSISGWAASARAGIAFEAHGSRSVRVSIRHADTHLHFTATGSSVSRLHPYLAGGE
ncbi:Imm50 family immunity protein [Streptomyces sp. NPDC101191]|uniref:Imm50 family immunity protein n=1 Tax=Streptomyces sp. NPDC101191 TaxID=3366126 RepID=UPI00380E7E36